MNPWHDVKIGEDSPKNVNAIIEIPRGSRNKYELDKDTGLLKLDRVLYSSMYYPHNYGFIPQTLGDDNDPLDIIVLSSLEVVPMCLVEAKVIGVMLMQDHGDNDEKIIAVSQNDMSVNHFEDISELPRHFNRELKSFFEDYKKLEDKTVVVEDFLGKEKAFEIIEHSIKSYNEQFK
ncbi:MAG: inorganic diphosphatase [Schleiferiaceae bacterium]|jgi:inorganic pyrophosphatase|nr:inorganic diphosphatase [Schleiferiaceae bacterium]